MHTTADFRIGLKVEIEGEPYVIVDFQHVKPGKGNAFVRTRFKNLRTGLVLDRTLKSGDKVGKPDLEDRTMQYMYKDDEFYHFMDTSNYEQIQLTAEQVGDAKNFLLENLEITALFFKGAPITVDVPNFIVMRVVKTDPGLRGDTATGGTKTATLETGHVIQVPLFLNEGDRVRIDTRTGAYLERVAG